MSEDHDPEAYEIYRRQLGAFAEALGRVVGLAEFLVSVADESDFWLYPEINRCLNATLREALIAADRAHSMIRVRPWGKAVWTPPQWGAAEAGLSMYTVALERPRFRWGSELAWLRDDGGAWLGWTYPDDVPPDNAPLWPRELRMLGAALKLVTTPVVGEPGPPRKVEEVEPVARFGSVKLYGANLPPIVKGKEKPTLSKRRYDALHALILACIVRVGSKHPRPSLREIKLKYEKLKEAQETEISKRLREIKDLDEDWKTVISLAGKPGGGYFIN